MGDLPLDLIAELFGYSILAALVAGLVTPTVGAYLLVRRTGFLGITLPQFAAAGVAFGFAILPWWQGHMTWLLDARHHDETHLAMEYHLLWAGLFTFGGLAGLTVARGSDRGGTETGLVAASFALASALTILFAHASPAGDVYVHELLRGEILAVDVHEFSVLALVLGLVGVLLTWRHRDLTLASFDPDLARVLGRRVLAAEALLVALTGATVAVGVMTVGPLVLFGLLVVPPLAARPMARSMTGFLVLASLLGVLSSAIGLWASFRLDWPLGPTLVLAAGLLLVLSRSGARLAAR